MFRTFDYKCTECKVVFEAMIQDDECPECDCGCKKLIRLMGAPLFELKGNGWPGKEFKAQSDCRKMAKNQPI